MTESVDELVNRIRENDADALAKYIEHWQPQLLGFIEKRLSDRLRQKVEAHDVLQEVSVSCLSSFKDVDFEGRDPFRWLCQQSERRIIDLHRHHFGAQKRAADKEVGLQNSKPDADGGGLEDMLAVSMTSPSAAFSRGQKEFHMLAALEELPEDAREALRLRYLEGLPSKEIAEELGKSDAATRVLLSRSLKKLQDILAANDEFQTMLAIEFPKER